MTLYAWSVAVTQSVTITSGYRPSNSVILFELRQYYGVSATDVSECLLLL